MYKFWRIVPGIFLEDLWALFPTKMRRKIGDKMREKNLAAQKKKSAKNPFCHKPTLKEARTKEND